MSTEIRRRKTGSPEIDAMVVLEQAMDALGPLERIRVLNWATERYGDGTGGWSVLLAFTASVQHNAETLGVSPDQYLAAMRENGLDELVPKGVLGELTEKP